MTWPRRCSQVPNMGRGAGAAHPTHFLPALPVHPSAWHSDASAMGMPPSCTASQLPPNVAAPGGAQAPPAQDPTPGSSTPASGWGHLFPHSSAPAAGAREQARPPNPLPAGLGGDALASLRARVAGGLPSRLAQGDSRGGEQGADVGAGQGSRQGLMRHSSAASGAAGGELTPGSAGSSASIGSSLLSLCEQPPLCAFPMLGARELLRAAPQSPTKSFRLEELGSEHPSQGFDSQQLGALIRQAASQPEYPGQGLGDQRHGAPAQSPNQGYAQPLEPLAGHQCEQLNRLVRLALAAQPGRGQGSAEPTSGGAPYAPPGGGPHQLGVGQAAWLGAHAAPQLGWAALGQDAAPAWGGFAPWPLAAPGAGPGAGALPQAGFGLRAGLPPQAGAWAGPGPSGWQGAQDPVPLPASHAGGWP